MGWSGAGGWPEPFWRPSPDAILAQGCPPAPRSLFSPTQRRGASHPVGRGGAGREEGRGPDWLFRFPRTVVQLRCGLRLGPGANRLRACAARQAEIRPAPDASTFSAFGSHQIHISGKAKATPEQARVNWSGKSVHARSVTKEVEQDQWQPTGLTNVQGFRTATSHLAIQKQ